MAEEHALLDRFPDLITRSRESRFEVNADSGLFTIDEEHAEGIRLLLEEVMSLLGEIEGRYAAACDLEGREAALVECSIADLSFLGKLELERIASQFAEARSRKRVWDVLRYADMGGSRAEQALMALEASIREAEGLGAPDHDDLDLGPALEVRRQYALLRHAMTQAGKPSADDLPNVLAVLLEKISEFRKHPTYAQVRVDDRLQIRSLQKRIRLALEDKDPEESVRLWQDLEGSISLLLQINRRTMLENHDKRIIFALGVKSSSTRYLSSLLGRSEDLDEILLGSEEASASRIESILDQIRELLFD